VHVDLPRALDRTDELDATAAVDEIEEHELSHVSARQHTAGEAPLRVGGRAVVKLFRIGTHACDLVTIGKALRRGHGARV
jgi:hypothetical protein